MASIIMTTRIPKHYIHLFFLLLMSPFCYAVQPAQVPPELSSKTQPAGTLLVLGDSLSAAYGLSEEQGWVALLGQRWREKFPKVQLVNASVGGATTAAGLQRLPVLLAKHRPQWVLLELGGNDGLQGKPIAYIRTNLEKMIRLSAQQGAEVFLIGMRLPPNLGERYTEPFFRTFKELSGQPSVTGYMPFLLDGVAGVPGMMQSDGIHPTASGQKVLYQNMYPVLEQWLADQ